MRRGTSLLLAVGVGAFLGACFRDVVRDNVVKSAVAAEGHQYKVVGPSMSISGYEEDLNEQTREGWRFVGTIPMGQGNAALIFER